MTGAATFNIWRRTPAGPKWAGQTVAMSPRKAVERLVEYYRGHGAPPFTDELFARVVGADPNEPDPADGPHLVRGAP